MAYADSAIVCRIPWPHSVDNAKEFGSQSSDRGLTGLAHRSRASISRVGLRLLIGLPVFPSVDDAIGQT